MLLIQLIVYARIEPNRNCEMNTMAKISKQTSEHRGSLERMVRCERGNRTNMTY